MVAWLGIVAAMAQAQPDTANFRPDVSVLVRKHAIGADLIEVSVLNSHYTGAELQKRILNFGQAINSEPRGLSVFVTNLAGGSQPGQLSFLKATFAVDGLVNGERGIRLEPLVQAFAGGQGDEEVKNLQIIIENYRAGPSTVKKFSSKSVDVVGQTVLQPLMLEYRVWLKSQDAKAIQIPDLVSQKVPTPEEPPRAGINPVLLLSATGITAIAAAVLVYNLALRGVARRAKRTGSDSNPVNRVP